MIFKWGNYSFIINFLFSFSTCKLSLYISLIYRRSVLDPFLPRAMFFFLCLLLCSLPLSFYFWTMWCAVFCLLYAVHTLPMPFPGTLNSPMFPLRKYYLLWRHIFLQLDPTNLLPKLKYKTSENINTCMYIIHIWIHIYIEHIYQTNIICCHSESLHYYKNLLNFIFYLTCVLCYYFDFSCLPGYFAQ